jgi:Ca-activated chloride channel family protein
MSRSILEVQPSPAATLVAVDGRTYPLEKADILARAEGGIATSTLVQTFANPYEEALELTYTLPLPADGAVLGYTIRVGEKLIRAEVQTREKASEAYKNAVFQGRTAGLLEQTRPDTFQQKLGNVPAHTKVEITIDVLHPLAFVFASAGHDRADAPHWEYRFPTVVGVRYHGAPGRVPDQADLSPDRAGRGDIPARVSLSLTLADPAGGIVHSPSHAIDTASAEDGSRVTFREGERLDRDVVVRWLAAADEVGARIVEGSGLAGDDGRYALVTLVPPAVTDVAFPRELTVLLDTSGSMTGMNLSLAKRVVRELLNSLEQGDQFEMIEFSDKPRRFSKGLLKVTPDTVRKAQEWLAPLNADGCTEMASAVQEALRSAGKDSQHQVVLVTDGEIGFEAEVVARLTGAANVRLHVVGVGHCPNRALTQQAAAAGRGLELLVENESGAGSAAARLIVGTARPVLTNVSVQGTAVMGEKREWLRDVFAGQPLLVTVELGRQGGTLEVRGDLAGSNEPWIQRISVPAAGASGGLSASPLPLGALHGRSVVGELEIRRAGSFGRDVSTLDSRIEALGLRHLIATSRTSMVAIEETPSVDPRQPSRRVKLAVELPAGVSAEGVGLKYAEAMGGMFDQRQMLRLGTPAPTESLRRVLYSLPTVARKGGPGPSEVTITPSGVSWLEPGVMLIEFVTLHDDFELPEGAVDLKVRTTDGRTRVLHGRVSESKSTPRGPHNAGMVVRLVIGIEAKDAWAGPAHVLVIWFHKPLGLAPFWPHGTRRIEFDASEPPQFPAK